MFGQCIVLELVRSFLLGFLKLTFEHQDLRLDQSLLLGWHQHTSVSCTRGQPWSNNKHTQVPQLSLVPLDLSGTCALSDSVKAGE